MIPEKRGGHNRKKVNEHFFKKWSPEMSYILGFIYADGAIINATKSSRTQYLSIPNTNLNIINKIKKCLSSDHKIYLKKARMNKFKEKTYLCKKIYNIRIGNREIYNDLIKLGVTPKKSLTIKLPKMLPDKLFCYFLRGYFDGDGCINIHKPKNKNVYQFSIILTCGSERFLEDINHKLNLLIGVKNKRVYFNSGAFRLKHRKKECLKILSYMYKGLNSAPYLERKYLIYKNFIDNKNN